MSDSIVISTQKHWWLNWARGIFFVLVVLLLLEPSAVIVDAQQTNSYLNSIGVPAFSVSTPVESGSVNLANGNLHLEIPLGGAYPQRGGPSYQAVLMYDSAIWYRWHSVNSYLWWPTNYGSASSGGWKLVTSADTGSANYTTTNITCYSSTLGQNVTTEIDFNNFSWIAPDGTQHLFSILLSAGYNPDPVDCTPGTTRTTGDAFATDRSGYHMFAKTNGGSQISTIDVYAPDGTHVDSQNNLTRVSGFPKDPNGNYYTTDSNNNSRLQHNNPIDTSGRSPILMSANGNSDYVDVLDSHGDRHRYTIVWETINVNTNFADGIGTEYSGTLSAIQEIDLPDGNKYQFSYDQGTTAGHFGTLTGMTLPSGGQVSYSYTTFADSYGSRYRRISGRTTSGSGIASGTWSYTPQVIGTCPGGGVNCQQKVTLTTPSGNDTVYTFNFNGGPWATQMQSYTGSASSGSLLATTSNSYDYGQNCPANVQCNSPGAAFVVKLTGTTILPIPGGTNLNQTRRLTWDPSNNGNVTKSEEWKFYTGSLPTTADRTTNITYLTGSNYSSRNIVNRPTNVTVTDKSGATVSQTLNTYDGPALSSATGKTSHDDTNFATGMTYRGNLTQIQRLVSGTTNLTTSTTYDMTGQVQTTTDPNGNQTTYDYTDNFYDDPGDGSTPTVHSVSTPTNAYIKKITSPTVGSTTVTTTFGYYWGTGKQALVMDPNSQISYSHFYDPLDRPTSAVAPSGGWTLNQYTSTQTQVDIYTGTTSSSASTSCTICRHDRSVLDVLGRPISQVLVNDPDGLTTTATTYDSSGRIYTVSNPYRSTSDATYGLETPSYDGLGRLTQVKHADNDVGSKYYGAAVSSGGGASSQNCSSTTYGLGYPVLSVDEVGHKRQTWTDGFGRTIEADEPNTSGTLSVGTCYVYDSNNNLTAVSNTTTSQTRSYSYDLLSRVTSTTTPESGTTNFYYTTTIGGSTLCSGDPSAVCLRKDARNITTTYAYDALNRLTSTTYSDSTPTVSYFYDQTSYNGLTITNGKGRRSGMSDGSGQTAWSFDSVGNILTEQRTIRGVAKAISYTYNPDKSIATINYPGSRVVTYTEGNAQRSTDAKDIANAINYATSATYAPPGGLATVLHGYVSGGFAGVTESYTYNNRLQFSLIQATSTAGLALSLTYSYAQSSHNNGDITTQTNGVSSGRTQTYAYDNLNRLLTAQSQATSGADCWGLSFGNGTTAGDDALNNLLSQSLTKCSGWTLNVGVNNNNQITNTGISYDSIGNNTADGSYSYTYDAENRIVSASGMSGGPYCYIYDGNGLRVAKAHGASCTSSPPVDVLYWRSLSGDTLAETDSSGSTSNGNYHEYVFFVGRRIARSDVSSGNVYFLFADHLGSTRAMTQANGAVCFLSEYYPYGQELNTTSSCSTNYKFTGYERDAETGIDYSFARFYNPRLARFMSGDPLGGSGSDPQTLNRYVYARNNPVNLIDPTGRECVWDDGSYDASDDPVTGSPDKCGAAGGTWIGHDIFANSRYYRGDWSGDPDQILAGLVENIQSCSAAAGGGQGAALLVANAFSSGFSNDQTAYLLATAAWESGPGGIGNHMTEMGGAAYFAKYDGRLGNTSPGDGALYRGRGYVQITGKLNYQTWSNQLGVNLVQNPGLAATPDIAAQIAVEGTDRGSFRANLSLYDFINPSGTDFFNARGVINGDKNHIPPGGKISNGAAIANSAFTFAGLLAGCR